MEIKLKNIKIKYITNSKGRKTDVVVPIKDFENLIEDLDDLYVIESRKKEEVVSHENVIKELKEDGLL